MSRLDETIQAKLEKRRALEEQGVTIHPHSFNKQQTIHQLRQDGEGASAQTAGRVMTMRPHGKVIFFDLKDSTDSIQAMVRKDEIDEKTFVELLKARGKLIDKSKKVNFDEIPKKLIEGKNYSELNVKPFFRLHPPRGGIDTKKHFGVKKGVLGNAGENIDKLLRRML